MTTILVEIRLLSEPRFDEVELGLPDDAPDALLLSFPLDNDLCHHIWKKIQDAVIKGSINHSSKLSPLEYNSMLI